MNISWIEKYRVKKLDEILSQEEAISILNNIALTGEMPHLLLHGGSGVGKTSSILALCNMLYGPKRINERVIELNASDERGINIVRNKIIQFSKFAIGTKDPNYICPPYKIIILDEADAMTKEAQSALRKIMEDTSHITRFCFICNYINKIIDPINSRCVCIKFKQINQMNITDKLSNVAILEKININNNAIECISEISKGDLRKALLMLQNVKYYKNENISENDIYDMNKWITNEQMKKYFDKIIENPNIDIIREISNDIIKNGYIFNSVLSKMIECVLKMKIADNKKAQILFNIGGIEKLIIDGSNEYLQLLNLFINATKILKC
jgi:replication factor C subunit 2/4